MPSTSWIVFGVIFAVGLLLLGISSAMMRTIPQERAAARPHVTWPRLVDEALVDADAQLRADMIERLSIIDTEWSRSILELARSEDPDASVRTAIELALGR